MQQPQIIGGMMVSTFDFALRPLLQLLKCKLTQVFVYLVSGIFACGDNLEAGFSGQAAQVVERCMGDGLGRLGAEAATKDRQRRIDRLFVCGQHRPD